MTEDTQQRVNLVQAYKDAVLDFENLEHDVDGLLQSKGGHTANLSDSDFQRYRELKERRDIAYNHMRTLEQILLGE